VSGWMCVLRGEWVDVWREREMVCVYVCVCVCLHTWRPRKVTEERC
jgi:hypothetical protein